MILSNPKRYQDISIFPSPYFLLLEVVLQFERVCICKLGHVLMTLNKRLDTAAAATVHRMIKRSRPRVLRPVLPLRKGSIPVLDIFAGSIE